MEFMYHLPVNLIFGAGKVKETGKIAAGFGKKVFLVTGRNSTKKSGLLDRVKGSLEKEGLSVLVFDQVTQNPLTTTALEGASIAKTNGCDIVVGLGGGSIMDCAKAIAFLAVNDGDINDYIFNRKSSTTALPIVLIPTTCGTGSEGNGFAVLTNPDNNDKKSLRCNAIIAKASIIDPECMLTMPKGVTASVGFDAFCHCMEAYLSKITNPIAETMCINGMQMISEHLVRAYESSQDLEAFEALSLASTYGGMVIHMAGVTLPHGMEHPASGLKDIVHGKGLAALTPVISEASYEAAPDKYETVSKILGGKSGADCGDRIRMLLESIDLQIGLSDLGIEEGDIPWMAENCMKVSAAGISNHPRVFDQKEIEELYRKAL
ncbi:MAG TPA: iron-containing alcohol dehydrogenase [Lachnospiraceae bacterium]|nr:iron-containing alcohol dehydrogenase [Lachnospiraceae bacterium]